MSKGGWAKLKKQQQQDSDGASQAVVPPQYKKVGNLKQLQLNTSNHPRNAFSTTTTPTSSPLRAGGSPLKSASSSPPRSSMLLEDQGNPVRASSLLRIVRRWKALSARSRLRQSSASSSSGSFSKLKFSPLACICSASSFSLSASNLEGEDDSDVEGRFHDVHIPSNSSAHESAMERLDSFTPEGKTQAPLLRRTLSCPKLIESPLLSCTSPSPTGMFSEYAQEKDVWKRRRASRKNDGGGTKLRRAASSPLQSFNGSKQTASHTPKGYLALYVGKEKKRFLVKANVLNHPMFSVLLDKVKEEFGFDQKGPLNIPCDIAFFEHIMLLVKAANHKSSF